MIALLLAFATGCTIGRSDGKIDRSRASVREFRKTHPCPATGKTSGACHGWVVDHHWPLCAGGCDLPENMSWQAVGPSRLKDVLERYLCGIKVKPEALKKARCGLKIEATCK